ncbi:hypothetical protein L596_002042 [Steinernema carpocapsae]|uniref:Uncharacterized protein n=1 Tax=Steinernema carpocapsae TaxID=34508 RepID=A0A4U8UNI3_STECR|nr:hypothetical protein L596_002042 [Steinernema carpocapsae]
MLGHVYQTRLLEPRHVQQYNSCKIRAKSMDSFVSTIPVMSLCNYALFKIMGDNDDRVKMNMNTVCFQGKFQLLTFKQIEIPTIEMNDS